MSIRSQMMAGAELHITITGELGFGNLTSFKNAYLNIDAKPKRYVLDISQMTRLDDSALGMLLMFRDFAGGDASDIDMVGCNHQVRDMLKISGLDQLFHLC